MDELEEKKSLLRSTGTAVARLRRYKKRLELETRELERKKGNYKVCATDYDVVNLPEKKRLLRSTGIAVAKLRRYKKTLIGEVLELERRRDNTKEELILLQEEKAKVLAFNKNAIV